MTSSHKSSAKVSLGAMEFTLFKSICSEPPKASTEHTILWGVFIAALGFIAKDVVNSYIIEPRSRYQALRREVAECLVRYSATYKNPEAERDEFSIEMSKHFRVLAGAVRTSAAQRRCYHRFVGIPAQGTLHRLSVELIWMGNCTSRAAAVHADSHVKSIEALIGIKVRDISC
jgi:hypothetical protein